ncbi:MAG: YeeE/YedE family protein [Hyphomicrobiaceae bacterium]|nr:YeeE/YedE family protein [Hyphomicrobiaceae bacterium]
MTVAQALTVLFPLAFVTGFALQRGNVCSFLAARQIVELGRASRLYGLTVASAWALAVTVPLAWISPDLWKLCADRGLTAAALLGGALYGLGSFTLGACIFGVCSRSMGGDLAFLLALPGICLGASLASSLGMAHLLAPAAASPLAAPSLPGLLLVGVAAAVAALMLARVLRMQLAGGLTFARVLTASRWRSSFALTIIGVAGGLLYATGEPWAYPILMRQLGQMVMGASPTVKAATIVGPIALFAGAIASAALRGRFVLRWPDWRGGVQATLGGAIMGFAATLIPGGNDLMVLNALPGLALNGIAAYVAMMATLVGLLRLRKTWSGA